MSERISRRHALHLGILGLVGLGSVLERYARNNRYISFDRASIVEPDLNYLKLGTGSIEETLKKVLTDNKFDWPMEGILSQYYISGQHEGIDISRPYGTDIKAANDGIVVQNLQLGYGYGWYMLIKHSNNFETLYAHLSQFLADPGDVVNEGDVIGKVGLTGKTNGPHVHFEIHDNGRPVNPLIYLPKYSQEIGTGPAFLAG